MKGGQEAGNEVCRSRSWVTEHRRHLAGRLVEPLRHVYRSGLVANRDHADAMVDQHREQRVTFG